MISFLLGSICFFSWAIQLPSSLSADEQNQILRTLGLGTSQRFLSQAYPLGGYSGFDIGLSTESISTHRLRNLGTGMENTPLIYPNLSIGKGIYNAAEIFIQFAPQMEATGFSRYGGSFRWSFYEAAFLPLNVAFVIHGSSANFRNQLVTRNITTDLMLGLTFQDFSFFAGAGWGSSSGVFAGGSEGVTLSQAQERHKAQDGHITLGGTYHFRPLYIGLSIDRFVESTYSLKLGLNY